MATSDRLTMEATSVPASAHTASVLSAPNRRNQRKPYTEATAFPTGSELVNRLRRERQLDERAHGGMRWPARNSSYCMAEKQT